MKYFFLSDGWVVGRVWEVNGLWNESTWRRQPYIQKRNLHLLEQGERLWLYQVESEVLMVEVRPDTRLELSRSTIGQVVLKRLITAEQVLERLQQAEALGLERMAVSC